jgi:hypothetical protein
MASNVPAGIVDMPISYLRRRATSAALLSLTVIAEESAPIQNACAGLVSANRLANYCQLATRNRMCICSSSTWAHLVSDLILQPRSTVRQCGRSSLLGAWGPPVFVGAPLVWSKALLSYWTQLAHGFNYQSLAPVRIELSLTHSIQRSRWARSCVSRISHCKARLTT